MNEDTPLKEIAHLMPRDVAELLLFLKPDQSVKVLTHVRNCMTIWEIEGVVLDPIALAGVMYGLVPTLIELTT